MDKEHYFCDTLEPTWRNLLGVELKPEEEDGRYSRVSGKKARKIPGHTAIPEGSYPVVISKSPRFKKWLPLVQGVPDFEGIRIHAGNYPDDADALSDYYHYSTMLKSLIESYEQQYGPLLGFGHSATQTGSWVCSEWPFE